MNEPMIVTKEDKIRAKDSARYNPAIDSGARGRIFENECARPHSRKRSVSGAGKADVHINYCGHYIAAECKTNGGRVDPLLDGSNKSKFVIYRLDIIQHHKEGKKIAAWDERRYVGPIIIPTEIFLACLLDVGAIKPVNKNGKLDGYGIQCSSKKLYQRLAAWPVKFDRLRNYTAADFEGLTL